MRFLHPFLAALSLSLCAGLATAQGSDACAAAQPISGDGQFNFVLLNATTDGLPNAACDFSGSPQIENDVWFAWTGTVNGSVAMTSCGLSDVDTKIAAYSDVDTCPPIAILACNDDACGLQSTITFPVNAGTIYLLRVGVFPGAPVGVGQLQISQTGGGGGSPNDDCANATPIGGLGIFSYDLTNATTDGSPNSLCDKFDTDQIDDDVWFTWLSTTNGPVTLRTCNLSVDDTKIAAYGNVGCPESGILACNDDTCGLQSSIDFTAVSGTTYTVRIGTFPGTSGGPGQFEVLEQGGSGNDCIPPSVGPDVIVGDLYGISQWGAVGGVSGYSIGTDSCNVGDQPLLWIAGENQHPVIAQNMYRLKDGRFEQIGQSWLKHGFAALNLDLCCPCQDPGTGALLGVGCSDPYDSGLNGFQSGLGPRWEVDPHTGAFPYPHGDQGVTGDAIYKRIQVANADLDPAQNSGALYFGEGHYVSPDDAQAGNQNNNASNREMAVGGFVNGGWSLTLIGETERRAPAIQAWQDQIPAVQLEAIQVPGDGLFVVGSLATDNGDGTWDYEYAVYNMNVARFAGSFSVPLAGSAFVTNVGFHDTDGHSGDPYSTLDWTAQVLAGSVVWSTQDYSSDPFANALRWGTLYNFRFTADAPPQQALATVELFAPGLPSALSVLVSAPSDGGVCGALAYCQTAPNSQGLGAMIFSTGSTSISANSFFLHSTGGVPNQNGVFYYGAAQILLPFGDGFRCVGPGGIGTFRLNPPQPMNSSGDVLRPLDFTQPPANAGAGMIDPGSTWNFQFWYRDPQGPGGSHFNLSDGLEVTFCP